MKRKVLILLLIPLLVLFALGIFQIYTERKAKKEIDTFLKDQGLDDVVSYSDVSYSPFTGTWTLHNVTLTLQGETVKIDKVILHEVSDYSLHVTAEGIRGLIPEGKDTLWHQLHYDEVLVDLDFKGSLNLEKEEAILDHLSYSIRDALELKLSGRFLGITEEVLNILKEEKNPENLAQIFYLIKVSQAVLSVRDLGIVRRIETSEEAKKSFQELEAKLPEDLKEAFNKFLEEGGKITLTFNPERPVRLGQIVFVLMTAEDPLRALDVEISHERSP